MDKQKLRYVAIDAHFGTTTYLCDYENNKECNKNTCQKDCFMTSDITNAKIMTLDEIINMSVNKNTEQLVCETNCSAVSTSIIDAVNQSLGNRVK